MIVAGQERFGGNSMPRPYYRNALGVLLVFDILDESTFKNINKW
jgi:GTPase SAR1 family protein